MGRDPFSEIERAAQAEKAKADQPHPPVRIPGAWLKQDERGVARVMVRKALSDENTPWRRTLGYVVAGWPLFLWLVLVDPRSAKVLGFLKPVRDLRAYYLGSSYVRTGHNTELAVALLVIACALSAVLYVVYSRAESTLRRAWLHRLGHGFDATRYLELLSVKRTDARLVVRFGFARSWEAAMRESTQTAVRHFMSELEQVQWVDDSTLEVKSGSLATTTTARLPDRGGNLNGFEMLTYFSNRAIHDCFVQVARHVLPKLDGAVAVQRLDVSVDGGTVPWYATPR